MKTSLLTLLLLVVLAFCGADAMAQCSMCKATVEATQGGDAEARARGLNNGILYLMIIPYIIFGVIVFLFFRHAMKEKQKRDHTRAVLQKAIAR